MANDDLKRFMVERLLELDPSLSDVEGSRIYTVVIDPLIKRIGEDPVNTDIESFIQTRLTALRPDLDVASPGSELLDVVVRPMQLLFEPFRREVISQRAKNTLADPDAVTEEEVDALVANIFAERNFGSLARGTQRIFFSAPRLLSVDNSIVFTTASGVAFVPDEVRVYQPSEMRASGSNYFIDIPIRSLEPLSEANVGRGEIRFVRNLDGVVRTTNTEALRFGATKETNLQLVERAERLLTERAPVTEVGIQALLRGSFAGLLSVDVIGYGAPEMNRDILQATAAVTGGSKPGALTAMTSRFQTEAAFNLGTYLGDSIVVPFTNLVRVENPSDTMRAAIRAAKFLRVADGNGHYSSSLVSRVRQISAVTDALDLSGDLIVRLADFTVYPNNADEVSPSSGGTAPTNQAYQGYNKYPALGSGDTLIVEDSGTDYVRGAPLPFTDTCELSIAASDRPADAIRGKDFLVVAHVGTPYAATAHPLPSVLQLFPIDSLQSGNILRVGRADGYMVSRSRIVYPGASDFVYSTEGSILATNEKIEIIDYGCPKYSTDGAERYSGTDKDTWSSSPGVDIEVQDRAGGYAGTIGDEAKFIHVTLEGTQTPWADRGVQVGHFISLAVFRGSNGGSDWFDGTLSDVDKLRWLGWGRITQLVSSHVIEVRGVDVRALAGISTSYDKTTFDGVTGTFASGYRAAWTVYRGERELVYPDGTLVTSYDDMAFLSSYSLIGAEGEVFQPGQSDFRGDEWAARTAVRLTDSSQHRAFWIRLGDSFLVDEPAIGGISSDKAANADVFDLSTTGNAITEVYQEDKYDTYTTVEVSSGTTKSAVVRRTTNPAVVGAVDFDLDNLSDWTQRTADEANNKGLFGYLLPHPMGSMHLDAGATYESTLTGDNTLNNQVLQFFDEAAAGTQVTDITVSGIPGSVVYPEQYGTPVTIRSDEVHIGGLTDVYVKLSSEETAASGDIKMCPGSLEDATQVLLSGSDGSIDSADTSDFLSQDLVAFVTDRYDITSGAGHMRNLVVQLVEPPSGIAPTSFRILNNITDGVRVDAAFTGVSGVITGLRWQLTLEPTMDLADPVEVLQQGSDLSVNAGSLTAVFGGGVTFDEEIGSRELVLRIASGNNKGDYTLLSKGSSSVGVSTAFGETATAVSYKIVAVQASSVDLPLVDVQSVSLSGEDGDVVVPYRHPVDVISSSFAGINDDPITDDSSGLNEGTLACDGTSPATFTVSGVTWADLGVIKYDVLRLDGQIADHTYWVVMGVDQDKSGASLTGSLKLDRVVDTLSTSDVGFTIGHPSVGTGVVRFIEPTLFEVDQDAVFSYVADDGSTVQFRPTPAESTKLYQPSQVDTPVTTTVATRLDFSSLNIFSHGIEVGDTVNVLSEVLQSAVHATDALDIANKSVVISVDDARRRITFTGTGTRTLADAAADINRQASDIVRAIATSDRLQLWCRGHLRILDEGTTGILGLLKFDSVTKDSKSDLTKFKAFTITALEFDEPSGDSRITLDGSTQLTSVGLFVDIVRDGTQRVYPGDMAQDAEGFWTTTIKLSSFDPLVIAPTPTNDQLSVSGYSSLGYDLVVDNTNYSFSPAEVVRLRTTGVCLGAGATDMSTVYVIPGSRVVVSYNRAPQVEAIQDFMLLDSVRTQCHNPLVRHFLPAYPIMDLRFASQSSEEAVEGAVLEYLTTLYPNAPLEVYDVLQQLRPLNVSSVTLPLTLGFLIQGEDRRWSIIRSQDVVVIGRRHHIMGSSKYLNASKT
jgi:hypothetical protein